MEVNVNWRLCQFGGNYKNVLFRNSFSYLTLSSVNTYNSPTMGWLTLFQVVVLGSTPL